MGCDIHAAVEWRKRPDWWVQVVDCSYLPRDYDFFACLVDGHPRGREWVNGVAPARGLPEDGAIARSVRAGYNDNAVCMADHTFSWLTPMEYRQALAWYADLYPHDPIDPEWVALGAYLDALSANGTNDVRLVFGFDN